MKFGSILFLALVLATSFYSCEEELVLPTASFTYVPGDIVQYDVVTFTSTSTDAESYLWDFGNGAFTSTDAIVDVQFLTAGTTTVKLTATNVDGNTTTEQTIDVSAPDNYCTVEGKISYVDGDGVEHIDGYVYDGSDMTVDTAYWAGSMIKLLATDDKFDNPLVIKFTPNLGIGGLNQVYTYAAGAEEAGTYDFSSAGGYAGMTSEWTVDFMGLVGDPYVAVPYVEAKVTLVFEGETSDDNVYDIVIENILINAGDYIGYTGFLESTNPSTVTVHWRGPITPEVEE